MTSCALLSFQMLSVTGIFMTVLQLGVFPPIIRLVGIVNWQRVGCLLSVPFLLAVPYAKMLSWDEGSLFAVTVLGKLLVTCSVGTVRSSGACGLQGNACPSLAIERVFGLLLLHVGCRVG